MKYLEGVSLSAVGRGNRRLLAPVKARHAVAKAEHAEELAEWRKQRAEARKLKDRAERDAALEALGDKPKGPIHPLLVGIGCAVVGAVVLWPATRGHHTLIAVGGAVAWVVAALIAGQFESEEKPAAAAADADKPEDAAEEDPEPTGPTSAEVWALTASLTADGTHVLLTRLAADLAASHPGWEAPTKAVRALLAGAGIRVREGVRTTAGIGPGVHHADVPPLPSPAEDAPSGAVVANVGAGHGANTNANNTGAPGSGKGFVSVPDPDDPDRATIIVYTDAAA